MGIGIDGLGLRLQNQEKSLKGLIDEIDSRLKAEIYKS